MPSKFFRSLSSDSSSSDDVQAGGEEGLNEINRGSTDTADLTEHVTTGLEGLSLPSQATDNSQILLHALLEERCMNEAIHEYSDGKVKGARRDEAAIKRMARAKYQRLCHRLAQYKLATPGLDHDGLASTRQRYRDGLDMISRLPSISEPGNVSIPLRRLLTEGDARSSADSTQSLQLARQHTEASSVLGDLAPTHPILEPSRYLRDFDELGVLGKGGYGVVYHVRNRLDDVEYAVKKVPISPARMARIRTRGQNELDELLREVKTMARLDHPNIVRYFGGWIEWSNVSGDHLSSEMSLLGVSHAQPVHAKESDAVLGAEDDRSLQRIVTQSDSFDTGIVFESSTSDKALSAEHSIPQPSVSLPSASGIDGISSSPALGPTLALHLQMGLYPLSLADFLSPQHTSTNGIAPLTHCFHLQPSLAILLALVDGVEYLHSQGIVHRDLKPANVFMAANDNPRSTRGSVDLFLCNACRAAGAAHPITLKVRIGDFGLVTALAQADMERSGNVHPAPVGTEIYRPLASGSNASASLDVYALGIIAFEMLWRFDTRMERHDTIQALKHGSFPHRFSQRTGDTSGQVECCIRDMLAQSGQKLGLQSLRQRLLAVQDKVA